MFSSPIVSFAADETVSSCPAVDAIGSNSAPPLLMS
jgi:hypothetical protein